MENNERIIAALSTPMGTAGVSVIRISGGNPLEYISKIFKPADKTKVIEMKTHTVKYGLLRDCENNPLDYVILLYMKAPNSFTGENTVEIQCHGGMLLVKKILGTLYKLGISEPEAGEFSKRAFLNGKMDLTQAESIMDLIYSKSDIAMKSAVKGVSGYLKNTIKSYREEILAIIANVEASIDYPEEDLIPVDIEEIVLKLTNIRNSLDKLIVNSENGKLLREGISTLILGKPNVGKSSLLNALLNEDRAIVTDIAGTTRDILTEYVNIKGIPLKLIDTAGIRTQNDENNEISVIEQIGIDKAKNLAVECDLIFMVIDGTKSLDNEDFNIIDLTKNTKTIYLLNKSDIEVNNENVKTLKSKYENATDDKIVSISAKEKYNFEEIYDKITEMFFGGEIRVEEDEIYSNNRQKLAYERAVVSINTVLETIENQLSEEFITIDLKNAYETLGEVIGESVTEDFIDKIFSEFCLGK